MVLPSISIPDIVASGLRWAMIKLIRPEPAPTSKTVRAVHGETVPNRTASVPTGNVCAEVRMLNFLKRNSFDCVKTKYYYLCRPKLCRTEIPRAGIVNIKSYGS